VYHRALISVIGGWSRWKTVVACLSAPSPSSGLRDKDVSGWDKDLFSVFFLSEARVDDDSTREAGVLSSVHHRGRGIVCSPCGGAGRQKGCGQD
jgi:hypothetical protein